MLPTLCLILASGFWPLTTATIAATAIAGGLVVASGFVAAGGAGGKGGGESANITSKLLLGSNIAGDVFTPLSLVATSFTGTATVHGELSWKELY
ncbi:hypothetical protein LCGC14_1802010 [marine sediment metagenome]|uniref:Uncharacterized protein n=1 Tax=marine sediment metagenome TaxID=412755 RepID=A0A0F9HC41_9ZZZZ